MLTETRIITETEDTPFSVPTNFEDSTVEVWDYSDLTSMTDEQLQEYGQTHNIPLPFLFGIVESWRTLTENMARDLTQIWERLDRIEGNNEN